MSRSPAASNQVVVLQQPEQHQQQQFQQPQPQQQPQQQPKQHQQQSARNPLKKEKGKNHFMMDVFHAIMKPITSTVHAMMNG